MSTRKNVQSTAVEISLVHLEKCLVNLPSSLVSLLVNVNTPVQDVVVELSYRGAGSPGASSAGLAQKAVYVGWTGMPSRRKVAPLVGRDGINGGRGRDQEVALVEIDARFAATLGLQDGQKAVAMLHLDPPTAQAINIEPLTPEDWEVIELHATFLEINMLSQIRAVPNPLYSPAGSEVAALVPHPLTLYLSPTSTANIKVVSLEPVLPPDAPFAKIAPDAEVIVAPKTRAKPSRSNRDGRSVGATSKRSVRSSASTVRRKSTREERRPARFLRGIDRKYCTAGWFDDDVSNNELSVWVDREMLFTQDFAAVKYASVELVRPAGLQPPSDPQKQAQDADPAASASARLVARLLPWDWPPNGQAVALSSPLCSALGCRGMVGGVVRIEPAPPQVSRKSSPDLTVQRLKVYPFVTSNSKESIGLKFGGESKAEQEEAAKRIKNIYSQSERGLLFGPLTDGQVLGLHEGLEYPRDWEGGILKFDPPSAVAQGSPKEDVSWVLGSDCRLPLEVQSPIPRPIWVTESDAQHALDSSDAVLVGIDALLKEVKSHLSHMSSVLLTGGQGSGKTSVAQSIVRELRAVQLYHTTYFPCTKLVNDESRIGTVKETLRRTFMSASWGARLGGKAVVILDDLDRLCPAETELQVGNENGRSRQISEAVCAIAREYCGKDSNVVLLATCRGKDALHSVIAGGHVLREIVDLKAPDKEARRQVLESVTRAKALAPEALEAAAHLNGSRPTTADGSADESNDWMDGGSQSRNRSDGNAQASLSGFVLHPNLDFLDIAGRTDGYMPGDLLLLICRARSEAVIRSLSGTAVEGDEDTNAVWLGPADFDEALKGFTPASLRNVTLQSSTTTFDSIGGLRETRRILLETLQYPTKYAPIFAQCPLRLRSGLLLYGYPGCGKTLLASAVAGECGLNFISVKGPEILNKYIGASEKSVRDLFERAQAARPCVLFFDEFDSIAPKRGHDSTGVTDRVVNQLLTQMDGAEGLSGVYVLAATSRPDLIDPALLRPGRLDKSLLCDFPALDDRLDIIRALAKKVKLGEDVLASQTDLLELGRRTEGFSGADLQALMSNAQLEAIHDVLHDRDGGSAAGDGHARRGGKKAPASHAVATSTRDFVQFRYGVDGPETTMTTSAERRGQAATTRAAELAEKAAIAAKLEGLRAARRRAKQQPPDGDATEDEDDEPAPTRPETSGNGNGNGNGIGNGVRNGTGSARGRQQGGSGEVVIGWKHITRALEDTRASISADERRRLGRIYREFVVGRSGEMRDGQGSMEVGGRSSLM